MWARGPIAPRRRSEVTVSFDINDWEPVKIGPTWQTDTEGKFVLPELTLGYECLHWTYANLTNLDGQPWKYTPEQARFILWYYECTEFGVRKYRDAVMQRLKGHGKDFVLATMGLFETCGPAAVDYIDDNGYVHGKVHPLPYAIIAATSKAQTKTTTALFPALVPERTQRKYGMKINKETINAMDGRANLVAVTSSPRTLEGFRPTWQARNEPHHWLATNEGHEMAKVMRRNAGKIDGTQISFTNAFRPGEDSVAERDRQLYDDILAGKAPPNFLYDSLEAPPEAPLQPGIIREIVKVIRGDSIWVNPERIEAEALDTRTPASESRRFYYNQIVSSEDALITAAEWRNCLVEDLPPLVASDEITLGLDPSLSDDSTALVAFRLSDRSFHLVAAWEKESTNDSWRLKTDELDGRVQWAMERYQVRAFFSDVHPIQSYVDKWSGMYGDSILVKARPGVSAVGFDMRGNGEAITRNNESLVAAFRDGTVKHNGDPILRQHTINAVQRFNRWGLSFGKESRESDRKVDAYAAMLLAFIAANKYLESGKRPPETYGGYWFK